MLEARPTVAILCGGRGTRLQEHTHAIPKPLVEVGGRPILWHVMQIYLAHGFSDFLLLTGYRGAQVEEFAAQESWPDGVRVRCLATGEDTPTGGRLAQAAAHTAGRLCVTYADGVADIDLDALLRYHAKHGAPATVSVVRPRLPFGVTELAADGRVLGFQEKPRSAHWVNGGFFVFEGEVLAELEADSTLEREPLEALARGGGLRAFRHEGFWECLDTLKDTVFLNDLWASGAAPWQVWV